jgi:hypothetical protein
VCSRPERLMWVFVILRVVDFGLPPLVVPPMERLPRNELKRGIKQMAIGVTYSYSYILVFVSASDWLGVGDVFSDSVVAGD